MLLVEQTVQNFIEEVDSKKPAPGGGSVSALASLLGLSLSRMVGHLTISKKSFDKLPPAIQSEFITKMQNLEVNKLALLKLIDADTEAFNQMMIAYKMPKETENDKRIREEAIQKATIHGINVPYEVVSHSLSILRQLPFFLEYGNASAVSDIGVGVLMISSGLEGAILNMKINLPVISDETVKQTFLEKINNAMVQKDDMASKLMASVHQKLE